MDQQKGSAILRPGQLDKAEQSGGRLSYNPAWEIQMLSGQTEEHRIHWLPNEAAATLSQHPQLVQESTESHWVQSAVWLALNRSQPMPTSTPCWWRHPELFGVITTFPLKPSSTQPHSGTHKKVKANISMVQQSFWALSSTLIPTYRF